MLHSVKIPWIIFSLILEFRIHLRIPPLLLKLKLKRRSESDAATACPTRTISDAAADELPSTKTPNSAVLST